MNKEIPETFRVKNWAKYQHYKDRCPPWIKLHWEIFSSRDWVMLADDSKMLAVVCMLIASRSDDPGIVPNDPDYIMRVSYLNTRPDFNPLIQCGFLEVASTCKQMQAKATTETDTETETET